MLKIYIYKSVEGWGPEGADNKMRDIGLYATFSIRDDEKPEKVFQKQLWMYDIDDIEFVVFDEGRLTGSRIENEEGEPDKNGKYLAQYDVYVVRVVESNPDTDELSDLFKVPAYY